VRSIRAHPVAIETSSAGGSQWVERRRETASRVTIVPE